MLHCQVQKHFQWNSPATSHDAFHMIMYELWLRHHVVKYQLLNHSYDNDRKKYRNLYITTCSVAICSFVLLHFFNVENLGGIIEVLSEDFCLVYASLNFHFYFLISVKLFAPCFLLLLSSSHSYGDNFFRHGNSDMSECVLVLVEILTFKIISSV